MRNRHIPLLALVTILLSPAAFGQWRHPVIELAPAPQLPPDVQPHIPPGSPTNLTHAATAISVDPFDRAAVAALYRDVYVAQSSAVINSVNVNVGTCDEGTTSLAFRETVIERVNLYRALAGLPGTVTLFGGSEHSDDQAATLIFVANADLSHNPPTSWACWSASGANGAGHSNITLGRSGGPGYAYNGVVAIDGYMVDGGSYNTSVGHRRWLLFPPQEHMASGDAYTNVAPGSYPYASSNALWVTGEPGYVFGPRPPTPNGTAWPPRGYVPWQLLPVGSNRWSFSYPGADFSTALVTMDRDGVPVPVSIVSDSGGAGDPTIVWEPGITLPEYNTAPIQDIPYHVTVSNISGAGASSYSYTVRVIDPYDTSDVIFADGFE